MSHHGDMATEAPALATDAVERAVVGSLIIVRLCKKPAVADD